MSEGMPKSAPVATPLVYARVYLELTKTVRSERNNQELLSCETFSLLGL